MEEELLERIRSSDPTLTKLHLVFEPASYFGPSQPNGLDDFLELLRNNTSITYVLLERRLARGLSKSDNVKLLRAIFEIPHIQEAEIWSQRLSWPVLWSALSSAKDLKKLGLGMISLTDVDPNKHEGETLSPHPTLETFYLSDFRLLTNDITESLSDQSTLPNSDFILQLLGQCPKLSRVEIFNFTEERPCATSVWPLLQAPRLNQVTLRRLHLPASAVQFNHVESIQSPLRILDISENPLGDVGCAIILRQVYRTDSPSRTTLRDLILKGTVCTTAFAPMLWEILSQTCTAPPPFALEKLNLASNRLRDDGARAVARLLEMPEFTLQSLELARCNITNTGAAALAQALTRNKQLRVLGLAYNKMDDASYVSFGDALARDNSTLQSINLQVDRKLIQKSGCMALQEMCRQNTTLEDVSTLLNTVVANAHGKYGNRIRMYLRLNKAGRAAVANCTATLEQWVQLLATVNDDLFAVHYLIRTHPSYAHIAADALRATVYGSQVEAPFAGLNWNQDNDDDQGE